MAYTDLGKNKMLDHLATIATKIQLYGDEEGGSGTAVPVPKHDESSQLLSVSWHSAGTEGADPGHMKMSNSEIDFEVSEGWTVTEAHIKNEAGDETYCITELTHETYAEDGIKRVTGITLKLNDPV